MDAVGALSVTPQATGTVPRQEAPKAAAATGVPNEAGTLHVLDLFGSRDAHGNLVVDAARQAGFHGEIDTVQIQGRVHDGEAILAAKQQMSDPNATKEQFLAGLDSYAVHSQAGVLNAATDAAVGLEGAGAHDSALNISRNSNKAEIVMGAWNHLTEADNPALPNAIEAFGLDRDKIFHDDPAISGPETVKLQQALVDRVSGAVDGSAEIRDARKQYGQAIEGLSEHNVSTVVSSGNEGEFASKLLESAYQGGPVPAGAQLRLPADFYDNPLSTDQTTTVGAVKFSGQGGPSVYADSTPSKNVGVFANGDVKTPDGEPEHGTSFAAPVVGAALARAHAAAPGSSPQQAKALLQESLTSGQPGVPAPVLDPERVSQFLDVSRF